ncbi:MAG: hypothetical protein M3M88_02110 [Thermoproteota archaeon]|nr:hypothetical protein [Thermoproteota archaeon]
MAAKDISKTILIHDLCNNPQAHGKTKTRLCRTLNNSLSVQLYDKWDTNKKRCMAEISIA